MTMGPSSNASIAAVGSAARGTIGESNAKYGFDATAVLGLAGALPGGDVAAGPVVTLELTAAGWVDDGGGSSRLEQATRANSSPAVTIPAAPARRT